MSRLKSKYDPNTPFQKIPDAVRTTGMSGYFLRSGCKDGTIPCIKIGNTYFIDVQCLLKRLHEQAERSAADLSA